MTVRRLLQNGDIATSGVQFLYGIDSTLQTLRTRLNLFYGEYFRDINEGTQWFDVILEKSNPQQLKDAEIQRRISNFSQTLAIVDYQSNFDNQQRAYRVEATVQTIHGSVSVNLGGSLDG